MISKKIGRVEFIFNNGAFSVMYHGSDHEYILNIKPTPSQAQELVIQLFVMKKAEDVTHA